LKTIVHKYELLQKTCSDLETILALLEELPDDPLEKEYLSKLCRLRKEFQLVEIESKLSGPHDTSNVIVSIHAGAGGTESCDWAEMLFRMYSRWAENKEFKLETVDILPGDEAGIKSITFIIRGEYAYGLMKSEKGVHRLVRISPFDSNKRRHTSFASCDVIPEIDDDIDIQINETELRIDTYRASGHGGQHLQKTDSAVRITHIPTNIVVQCQNERSQFKNKQMCMKLLKAKLYDFEEKKRLAEIEKHNAAKSAIAWGSQIRSYVFMPYQMVKDHRTDVETGDIKSVMDGEIDMFIQAYLNSK